VSKNDFGFEAQIDAVMPKEPIWLNEKIGYPA